MTDYRVTRAIAAPPEQVWEVLTDTSGYTDWNEAVVSIEGDVAVGEKIQLVSAVNPKRAFRLTVSELSPPSRMVWSDGMPLGLFRGVRTFTLTAVAVGTEFEMREAFSGPLAPLITKAIPDMMESFEQWADGLARACEG